MFTSGYKESSESCIAIPDVSYEVFMSVLTFLYTGKPRTPAKHLCLFSMHSLQCPNHILSDAELVGAGDLTIEMAVEVMSVANLYVIEPLKLICADVVAKGLSVQNAADMLQAAETYQAVQLRATCINFMVNHFAQVTRSAAS